MRQYLAARWREQLEQEIVAYESIVLGPLLAFIDTGADAGMPA